MAIVVEEEQNKGSIMGVLMWSIIVIAVLLAVYYIFFKKPEIVERATPARFANIEQLLKERIEPDEVLGNPRFKSLQPYIAPLAPQGGGRDNPFLGSF